MNKQELIEKYQYKLYEVCTNYGEYYRTIAYENILKDLENLDEPQKPAVPQFVADFITEQKKLSHTLSYSIDACMSDGVAEWYWDNSELFVRAWLDGYTVEKEKRYLVKIKGIDSKSCYLKRVGNKWIISGSDELRYMYIHTAHTRKELEVAGFGEVFNSPLFEVEEVE